MHISLTGGDVYVHGIVPNTVPNSKGLALNFLGINYVLLLLKAHIPIV